MITLTYQIVIHASQQTVFEYVADWEKQSDWILFTTVKNLSKLGSGLDTNLLAVTKLGPLQLKDTMVITSWQPFDKITVEHTGRIVLGKGIFSVRKINEDRCEFVWQEATPIPFGFIGQTGLLFAKPFMNVMFNSSLRKLKANIETV